jgi:hypothetical protein
MKISPSPLAAILLGTTLLFGDASPLTRGRHLQDDAEGEVRVLASTNVAAANTNKNIVVSPTKSSYTALFLISLTN